MANPYLGEIRVFGFGFAPKGWALCNGQTVLISQNQALFALLGTMYGGDGQQTFQLPNLQARMPVHASGGFPQGAAGGETAHTLVASEMPAHNHAATGVTATATSAAATDAAWAASPKNPYATSANATMASSALSPTGGGQPHDNMPPYLTLNFCIALSGIFPTRN